MKLDSQALKLQNYNFRNVILPLCPEVSIDIHILTETPLFCFTSRTLRFSHQSTPHNHPLRASLSLKPKLNLQVKMSNAKSPEILAAYDDVRSDKSPTNWLLISYAKAMGDALTLTATGEGGISELREKLDPNQAQYAYIRVEYANDSESSRVKFAFIVWIGEYTKVMRKAGVSIESGAVKAVLNHHSISIDARSIEDVDEAEIIKLCRKAGGADYNGGRG